MFHSYTGREHKNMLVRFSIHQINALSSCCYLSKVLLQKRGMGICKSYSSKRRKKELRKKWISVRDTENNGYSYARLKRKKKKEER
jgi:hypothetical protein